MTARSPRSDSIIRRRPRRGERPRLLVVTEGERTERQYLEGLAQYARATGVDFHSATVVGLGRDPHSVVQEAVRRRAEDRRSNPAYDRYSDVWCVFDVDEHASLDRAVAVAQRESISLAISNPCFEIWLLWHFEDCRAVVTATALGRRLRKHRFESKCIPPRFPFDSYVQALDRASAISGQTEPYSVPDNPGCSLSPLIELIARRGRASG